jgi:hypothetical protein
MSIRCGHCKARHESAAEVKACSAGPRADSPSKTPTARPAHVAQAVTGQAGSWDTPADEGVYRVHDRIYRVVVKANGSGRPYAEEMVNGKYVYAKGMVFRLRPQDRMSLEEAKAWGRAEVRCIRCGIKLEKASSREAGIGPICATKV